MKIFLIIYVLLFTAGIVLNFIGSAGLSPYITWTWPPYIRLDWLETRLWSLVVLMLSGIIRLFIFMEEGL